MRAQTPMTYAEVVAYAERLQTLSQTPESIQIWSHEKGGVQYLTPCEWNSYSVGLELEAAQHPLLRGPVSKGEVKATGGSDKPEPCYAMEYCKGGCGNPFHTDSNVRLSKAVLNGELWGDLVYEIEEEERAAKAAADAKRIAEARRQRKALKAAPPLPPQPPLPPTPPPVKRSRATDTKPQAKRSKRGGLSK
jgi:hypothetical protein